MTERSLPAALPLPPETARNRLLAIGLMCGAVLLFAMLDASAKWLAGVVDPLQVVFARYAGSMILGCSTRSAIPAFCAPGG